MNIDTRAPGNRAARRAQSAGRHRQVLAHRGTAAIVVAAAVAAGIALAPAAQADPGQAGISDNGGQAGISDGDGQSGLTTPAPAPAPAPQAERTYWVEPPAQYSQTEWQTWDAYYDDESQSEDTYISDESTSEDTSGAVAPVETPAPLDVGTLHGPIAIEDPTVPIAAPEKIVKVGDFYDDQPSWLSDEDLERTNNSTAVIEAQVTDFWRSVGVPTDRAQRLSAAQIAAGGAGMVTGAVALGGPATLVGALGGGTIGGIGGALAGGLIPVAPGIAPITTGIAGTAAGAALGAGALGLPATALGAVTGLGIGVGLGTTYGAGDLGEPQKIDLPDFPETDGPAQEAAPVAPAPLIEAAPAPIVQAAPVWTEPAQVAPVWTEPAAVVDTARDFVSTQTGGQQVLDAVDRAAADAAPAFAAIDNAINAAFNTPLAPA